jgi:hypothetical protein
VNQPTVTGVALRQEGLDTHFFFPNHVPQNTGVPRDVNSCNVKKNERKKHIFLKFEFSIFGHSSETYTSFKKKLSFGY